MHSFFILDLRTVVPPNWVLDPLTKMPTMDIDLLMLNSANSVKHHTTTTKASWGCVCNSKVFI